MTLVDRDLAAALDSLPYGEEDKEQLRRALMKAFQVEQTATEWLTGEHIRFAEAPIDRARRNRTGLVEVWSYLRHIAGLSPGNFQMIQK